MSINKDSERYIDWDSKYYLRHRYTLDEWTPFVIEKVEECYIYDNKGNKILDFMGGWYCIHMGQRNPKIIDAIKKALDKYGWVPETNVTPYKSEAAKIIMEDLVGPDKWAGRIRFVSTGSEAIEEAMIIAKLFTGRPNILSRQHEYHGWTYGAVSAMGLTSNRNTLASSTSSEYKSVPTVPAGGYYFAPVPCCYRCPLYTNYPSCKVNGILRCVQATEDLLLTIGPHTFAAMVGEVNIGIGIIPPPEYLPQMKNVLSKYGILWIDDEVMGGFGRLGKWFGYQLYDVNPDIMVMGKGIVSSHLPAAGVVVSKDIAKFMEKYRWMHFATYAAHPVCMAAVVSNLKVMIEEKIPERANKIGQYLGKRLKEQEKHKCVGLVNGIGMYWAIELVKNKKTKEPFIKDDRFATYAGDTSQYPIDIVFQKGLEKNVILSGSTPNTLRFGPPLIITKEEIDQGIEALDYALTELDKYCD